ncbi:MAG: hypothetical protein ACE37F_12055 [Nannocystaceae bacterium]|nr:hypothetical protein [bacterium]
MKRCIATTLILLAACIVPDRGISFEGGPENEGAVRILQRAPLPEQWEAWCLDRDADIAVSEAIDGGTGVFCHSVEETRSGGLIRGEGGEAMCVCPAGQRDLRAPELWTIYAEDPDLEGDDPADVLYGVLLLDPDPVSNEPSAAVAYENYLEPCAPGRVVDPLSVTEPMRDMASGALFYPSRVEPPLARNDAWQWAFRLDDAASARVDLCNDDNGSSVGPGLHNLQFMVTDRPFFRAVRDDVERLQCGVPDVAAGATYAVINYVFECVDGTNEATADQCDCGEVE